MLNYNEKQIFTEVKLSNFKVSEQEADLMNEILQLQEHYFTAAAKVDVESFLNLLHPEFRGWTFNKPELADKNIIGERLRKLFKGYESSKKLIHITPMYYYVNGNTVFLFVSQKTFLLDEEKNKKLFVNIVGAYLWVKEENNFALLNATATMIPESCQEIPYITNNKLSKKIICGD